MKYLPLGIFIHDEVYRIAQRVIQIIGAALEADPLASLLLPLIQKYMQQLGQALGREQTSKFTTLLAEKDALRDAAFVVLRDYAGAFVHVADPARSVAGQLIVDLVQKQGWSMHNAPYGTETTQLNLLLEDLETEEAQQALTTIDATEWFTNLKTAQGEFESVYQDKLAADAEDQPLIGESRKKLIRYLSSLLNYIDIQSELNSELFGPIAEKIDELNTDMVAVARARRTRKEGDGDGEAEVETVTESPAE